MIYSSRLRLLGLAGSLRETSLNRGLLRAAREVAPGGLRIDIWDRVGEIPLYNADLDTEERRPEVVRDLKREIAESDGLVIASPEYNYGVPGVLKNAIDWASRPGFGSVLVGKPVLIMGASGGALGTARMQTHLREILYGTLALVMPHRGIVVGNAREKFADGELTDEPTREFIRQALASFAEFIRRVSPYGSKFKVQGSTSATT